MNKFENHFIIQSSLVRNVEIYSRLYHIENISEATFHKKENNEDW